MCFPEKKQLPIDSNLLPNLPISTYKITPFQSSSSPSTQTPNTKNQELYGQHTHTHSFFSGADDGRGSDGLLRPAARRRPARHPGGGRRRPPQPRAPRIPALPHPCFPQAPAAAATLRRDRRPDGLQVQEGHLHPRTYRARPLPPRAGRFRSHRIPTAAAAASNDIDAGARAAAAQSDAGLHQAERVGGVQHLVAADVVGDVDVLLLLRHRWRRQRVEGQEPSLLREAAAGRVQEEAVPRALRGCRRHRRWPVPLLQEKEESGEEDGQSSGDQLQDRRHPAGRVLVEEVRPEADQRLPLPTRVLQVQYSERMSGEEARRARHRRPDDARRHVRRRAPPHAGNSRCCSVDGDRDDAGDRRKWTSCMILDLLL